jgi:hypothetical protein
MASMLILIFKIPLSVAIGLSICCLDISKSQLPWSSRLLAGHWIIFDKAKSVLPPWKANSCVLLRRKLTREDWAQNGFVAPSTEGGRYFGRPRHMVHLSADTLRLLIKLQAV